MNSVHLLIKIESFWLL